MELNLLIGDKQVLIFNCLDLIKKSKEEKL